MIPTPSTALPAPRTALPAPRPWQIAIPLGLFAVMWLDLLRQLSYTWETREQYSYGYFVPFFAAFLFWRRWQDRPSAGAFPSASASNGERAGVRCPKILTAFVIGLALLLLPLRVVFEINADWPLISWLYAIIVVVLTLHAFYLAGSWPWVRHFLFPVAFILVTIAWPYRIEKGLTQTLMQVVANITVEVLSLLNIPAVQRGNLIEVSTGVVGVDEACSGIRSFQSSLMAGLLMGELYRLRAVPRVTLFLSALAIAFVLNIGRTLLLSYQASQHGVDIIDKWHDGAGLTILVGCFFCLWGLSEWMKARWGLPRKADELAASDTNPGKVQTERLNQGEAGSDQQLDPGEWDDGRNHGKSLNLGPFVQKYILVVGCWALFCLVSKEVWFRAHERQRAGAVKWSATFPEDSEGFQKISLSQREISLLKFDLGHGAAWAENDAKQWVAYYFRWNPDSMLSRIKARSHRPEQCLPASDRRLEQRLGVLTFRVGELSLPFETYVFEERGDPLHVFFCLWEDGAEGLPRTEQISILGRLDACWRGIRAVGQQTLAFYLRGYSNAKEAETALRERLPRFIRFDVPG